MGDEGQHLTEGMGIPQKEIDEQDISQASGSGMANIDKVGVDGYSVLNCKPTTIFLPPLKSKSWRIRLKRVRNSLSSNRSAETDEPSTSSVSDQNRYSYGYAYRIRCTSPEVLPKIDSQNLLEIAASTAQAFKDISAAMKKRGEAKTSSKKGRKSLATSAETASTPPKQTSRKRSKEPEQLPKPKEKPWQGNREDPSESKEKARREDKETLEPQKKKKKEKKKSSSPMEKKEVNGRKFNLSSLSRGTPSPSDEVPSNLPEKAEEVPKDNEVTMFEKPSSSVNIRGWSKEKIIEYFDLKEFTIDVSDFPHHELRPSTSSQSGGEMVEGEIKTEQIPEFEAHTAGSGLAPEKEKDKENVEIKPEEKNRKRKRSASSSSSCSSASSSRHRSSDESDSERNTQAKSTAKKKAHSERPCVECGRWLDDCVRDWRETLGQSSVWCSRECIERRVARAHEVLPEGYGALTLLRGDGQLLTTGPTLMNLAEFIYKYPEYEPVLPVAKKKSSGKSELTQDPKKSNPKVLSKDSDRVRFNVKRAFSDALMKRAKMDKVKSAVKLCKDIAENVEAALFKCCGSNLNSPKYKGWTKVFIENVADCRNKSFYYRVLTGMISVHKVVTLDGDDMKKPEYSAPLDEDGENVGGESVQIEDVIPSESSTSNAAKLDESASDMKEISTKHDGGSETAASASETNLLRKAPVRKEHSAKSSPTIQKKQDVKPLKRATRRSDAQKPKPVSALDAILGDGAKDTTEQHLSHFYDVNCSICLAKQKSQAEAERKEREEKEKQREEDRRFREMLPLDRRPGYSAKDHGTTDPSDISGQQNFDEFKRVSTPESTGAACASDEDYAGSFVAAGSESPVFGDSSVPLLEPRRPLESWRERREPAFAESVWSGPSTTLWNGKISINNTMIMTSLCLVSNPVAYRTALELPPVLRIKGRIGPVIVFDYVHGVVKSREHHVCVLRLTTPIDYDDEQRFFSIYEDMIRKGRYFAIDVPPDSCFKDMYLMPLPPGEEPPAIFLPFDGPGIPPRHPPMIICVMVVYGSGRLSCPEFHASSCSRSSFRKDTLLGQSSQDPPVGAGPAPSRPLSSSLMYEVSEYEKTRPISTISEEVQPGSDRNEEEIPTSEKEMPEPEVESHDTAPTSFVDISASQSEPQSQSVVTTPSDSPQVNFAPVCEADSLLPSKFFMMCKEAAKEPAKVPDAEEIDSLPDLLVYIQLNNNPREIKEVVARFMMNPTLSDEDRELIRRKVMEKISAEKKKKAENRRFRDNEFEEDSSSKEGQKSDNGKEQGNSNGQELLNIESIDIGSLNQLSSFVGDGVKELLKQVDNESEPAIAPPPSPPPPPPPAPPLQELQEVAKQREELKGSRENALSCNEMLPGPPPVPPVYGDNESSESESPSDQRSKNVAESPSLPLPPPFPTLNVVPLPPPPPVVSSHPDIAVPPPPPPPPSVSSDKVASSTSSAQSFIAPPPPPPVLTAQSMPAGASAQIPRMSFPPPPGLFPPFPMPPIPNMIPGFHPPPFMSGPPPTISGITSGTPRSAYPPQSNMVPPPQPMMQTAGFHPQPQSTAPSAKQREFFPCTTANRPGLVHGPPPGFPPPPQAARIDISQDHPSAIAGTLPANHGAAGFLGAPRVTQQSNPVSELAPLPSQIASASVASKRVLPTRIIQSLGHALTEKELIPRTPTPPPSPPLKRVSVNRNGPRTPSPDFLKKRHRDEAFERLKNDVAARRKEFEIRAKREIEERNIQTVQGSSRSSDREGSSLPWHDEFGAKDSYSAQEPTSSKGNASDSDAMEVDAGESEGENDFDEGLKEWSERPIYGRGRGAHRPVTHGMQFGPPQGRRAMPPPPPRGHGPFPVTPRIRPPQQPGRGSFSTPRAPAPAHSNRGGFFSPQMRSFRGAPNLRRGLPFTNRGSGGPAPARGGFPPRGRPYGGGEFYGSRGMPRGGPLPRGLPQNRRRGMF